MAPSPRTMRATSMSARGNGHQVNVVAIAALVTTCPIEEVSGSSSGAAPALTCTCSATAPTFNLKSTRGRSPIWSVMSEIVEELNPPADRLTWYVRGFCYENKKLPSRFVVVVQGV